MKPCEICFEVIGREKLIGILDELTNPQVKAVLKEGDVKVKLPGGYVGQQKRRELWATRIMSALEQENHAAAGELLQQFLLNHRRALLIDYLDRLEVKHRNGETDESFLIARPAERVREAATWLLARHDRAETTAYLRYVAHQQRSSVFDGWSELETAPAAAGSSEPAVSPPEPAQSSAEPAAPIGAASPAGPDKTI